MDKHTSPNLKNQIVVVGYGDVGRQIAKVLHNEKVNFIIIDQNRENFKGSEYRHIIGDGTDEGTLKRAGTDTAHTVIISLNNDTDAIFSTLVVRNINPHAVILARANSQTAIDKMYKAGADYVASLPIISGQMLVRLLLTGHKNEETILMYEGLQVEKYTITKDSPLKNKTIQELSLPETTGCNIIAIKEDHTLTTMIAPGQTLKEGATLAIVGTDEQIKKLKEKYLKL